MNTKQKHVQYYVSLATLLTVSFVLIILAGKNQQQRMLAVMLTSFIYVVWGIVHHIMHHDTSVRVVIEYVLIGALGILLALLAH